MVEDLLSVNMSPECAARLRLSRLIPLQLGEKIRPIAIESAIAKLISIVGLSLIPDTFVASLAPIQKGVGGNVEIVATGIRDALREHGVGFFYDGKNSYNSVCRNALLREVYRQPELRPIWGITRTLLGTEGDLGVFDAKGHRVASITSSRGIRQGMIFGPLFFALAIQPSLLDVRRAHPNVTLTAYLDDVTCVGSDAGEVAAASRDLVGALARLGIRANTDRGKCAWVNLRDPSSRFALADGTEIHPVLGDEVLRILGIAFAPSGSLEPVSQWLLKKAEAQAEIMQAIPGLNPQIAAILLQQCVVPRFTFFVRTHTKAEVQAAATRFDDCVMDCLAKIMGISLDVRSTAIARLPVRLGGLGLTSMAALSDFANNCLHDKGAQKIASTELAERLRSSLFSSLSGPEKNLVLSHSSKTSARIVRDGRVELTSRAAQNFLRERLLIQVAPKEVTRSRGAKPTNQHIMCCQRTTTAGKIRRHDGVVAAVANAFASLGLRPQVEPRVVTSRSRARPDLIVDDLVTDVTIRYPAPASATSIGALNAADKAAAEKNAQWRSWADRRDLRFAPLVFESTGALLEESVSWIRAAVTGSDCLLAPTTAADFVVCAALAAFMRGNVWVVASALG